MSENEKDVALDALDNVEKPLEYALDFVTYDETFDALPSDEAMRQVADLGLRLRGLQKKLAINELEVESLKSSIREYEERLIPEMLMSLGLTSVTLSDGTTLEVKDEVYASISDGHSKDAFRWLRFNKFGDLIKNEITVSLSKAQDKRAEDLVEWLTENGYHDQTKVKESVHPQTLKAFVKEQDKRGASIPEDLFGVHRTKKVKVKKV